MCFILCQSVLLVDMPPEQAAGLLGWHATGAASFPSVFNIF
jgi:hypothetical protein